MITEAELAVKAGLARVDLAKRRLGMVEGEDWKRGEMRRIYWTEAGVLKLGLGGEKVTAEGEVEGVIVRANYRNARLVTAKVVGEERVVLVRDANMYVPGQKFTVRRNGEGWMESRRPKKRGYF